MCRPSAASTFASASSFPATTPGKSIISATPIAFGSSARKAAISSAVTVAPLDSNGLAGTHEETIT
jgi:hypothetical protein